MLKTAFGIQNCDKKSLKVIVMQIEEALITDRVHASKVS